MALGKIKADTLEHSIAGSLDTQYVVNGSAKVTFNMNLRSSTTMGIVTNGISSECLNISSGTDSGTGLSRGNITNAMQNTQYIWVAGSLAANNTQNCNRCRRFNNFFNCLSTT